MVDETPSTEPAEQLPDDLLEMAKTLKLKPQQIRFAQIHSQGHTAKHSALAAGYSPASVSASSSWLKNHEGIRQLEAAIRSREAAIANNTFLSRAELKAAMTREATLNPSGTVRLNAQKALLDLEDADSERFYSDENAMDLLRRLDVMVPGAGKLFSPAMGLRWPFKQQGSATNAA
jgi:hypothetical protein